MKFVKQNLLYILAFGIPFLIMILMYIIRGIYPFGDECYLRSDMFHQYAPFLKEFYTKISDGGSLLYSWNIGMGVNFLPIYSYYLASPLNWIILLLPSSHIIEIMSVFIIIKIGLMSLTFSYYISKHYNTKHVVAAVFSSFYALSSYIAAFSWNLMWLDCLLLLPLVILGLERLVKEGKCLLYCITLGICIISNYYIAIMICIFCLIYFIYMITCHGFSFKKILNFSIYSLLAGGLGAFLVLPTYLNLALTASGDFSFPMFLDTYFPVYKILARGLINVDPAIFTAHDANIYSSVIVFLLIPLYYFNKKISLKEKIGKTVLLVFFIMSFNLNYLDYIWHGFHFPNSLPCRESFIFIFLILVMSFDSFTNIGNLTKKQIFGTLAGATGLLLLFEVLFTDNDYITSISIYASIIFIAIYVVIFMLFKRSTLSRNLIFYILFIIAALEMIINTNSTALGTTSRSNYISDNTAIENLLEDVYENDDDFYRIEKFKRRTKNDAAWHDYKGVSVFSSTANAGLNKFLSSLGFEGSTNAYAFYGHTPLTSSILSVKYMLSDFKHDETILLREYGQKDGSYLYENEYTLPLGFMVDSNFEIMFDTESMNPFMVQNNFIQTATGYSNLFSDIPVENNGSMSNFYVSDNMRVFIYPYSDVENIDVQINNYESGYTDSKYLSPVTRSYIIDLGEIPAGCQVNVSFYDKDGNVVSTGLQVVYFNTEMFLNAFESLNSSPLIVEQYDDGYVSGTITADEEGLLFTSIPFDNGWRAYIDGEEVTVDAFKDALISIKVPEGTHKIEFKFSPKGFAQGMIVSILSLLIIIALSTYKILRKHHKNPPQIEN